MATWAKAAKNYSMKKCDCCKGAGIGAGWICSNCDGNGKVSIYPVAPNNFANCSTCYESYATAK